MTEETFPVEVRRTETTIGETGVGAQPRVDVNYELGAVVGGAWVRFTSVPGNTVDALVANAPAPAAAEPEGPTMAEVTPTPAPQQQAAEGGGTTSV